MLSRFICKPLLVCLTVMVLTARSEPAYPLDELQRLNSFGVANQSQIFTNLEAASDIKKVVGFEFINCTSNTLAQAYRKHPETEYLALGYEEGGSWNDSNYAELAKFKELRYLEIWSRTSFTISDKIESLKRCTKLIGLSLRFRGFRGTGSVTISDGVYALHSLEELYIYSGSGSPPIGISKLSNLLVLELLRTPVTELPKDFDQLKLRGFLCVAGGLSNNSVLKFPKSLEYLDLTLNEFKSIPAEVLNSQSIKYFILNHNNVQNLPTDWSKNPQLRIVSLTRNEITNVPPLTVLQPPFERFELYGNPIQSIDPKSAQIVWIDTNNFNPIFK